MRLSARLALIVVTAIIVMLFYVPLGHADYTGRWGEGTFGITLPRAAATHALEIAPNSPAARAGIQSGDEIVTRPFSEQWEEVAFPHVGDRMTISLRRGTSLFTATLTAQPVPHFGWWDRVTGILAIIPATIFFVIAAVLVFLRPSVMTWSFLAYAAGYYSTGPTFEYYHGLIAGVPFLAMSFMLFTVFGNLAVMPLLLFVLRFPDNTVSGWTKVADRIVWMMIALAFLGYANEWRVTWSSGDARGVMSDILGIWLPLLVFVAAAAIVIEKYKLATPATRQRFGFLVVGLIVSFVAYAVYFVPGVPFAAAQVIGYGVVLMPISVAYAVLRHRVLDVNFVLNRAIAYGVLSIVVIAFISLLDWGLSHVVAEQRLATGIELLVTIGVGFLLDRINHATESLVESVFFRQRRQAESYLRRAAEALPYATDESAISDGLTQVPVDGLGLAAAALYRRSFDGARFEGIATSHDTMMAPSGFDRNHLLVRMLQASEARVWLDEVRSHLDPENAAIYVLALPITVRHELVAFALYGAHRNGAQLDPEEVTLLLELAREAARAYDHVEAVRTRERYARFMVTTPETA